jgi:type I restriction enzyme R subunit
VTHSFTEANTIQAAVIDRLAKADMGWQKVTPEQLERDDISALIEPDITDALIRLNPVIANDTAHVDQVLPGLRAAVLSSVEDGLIAANERMMNWLRGTQEVQFVGEPSPLPVRLIDFDNPRNNELVVSSEVTFKGTEEGRFDIVLFVNGFPLVVGETKTPTKSSVSWLNAARDVHNTYEREQAGFFVPNVLSFATEGKDFRYGPIGMPAEFWLPWGKTSEEPPPYGLARALHAVELLLAPEQVLDILRTYTLFSTQRIGKTTKTLKVIPRYPQVEAVEAIAERVADPKRKQGLIWHHQGSGKTLLSAFACGKLRRRIPGCTVIVLLDRLDLIEQTTREFESAGVEHMRVAETKEELQELISQGQRGVIVTTIFRFAEAGHLTDRDDVIVIADEAHRTQEGILGKQMRKALPNATFIGMTGTPISYGDRDTFEWFGDPDDPEYILNAYPPERSMADGATLPIRVEAPRQDLQLDAQALDAAFDELAEQEGLSDEDKERLARKVSNVKPLLRARKRIRAVCEDIVEHYYAKVAPLGLKAQVVVYDRELCVAYWEVLSELIAGRKTHNGRQPEATVVMTAGGKDDPSIFKDFARDRAQEAAVKGRFRDYNDPLQFLIVTAKLLTGFDAPIEGVMYLDKPLRRHTLFQALARTNRRWTNPETEQEKTAGLVVDYVGLGKQIAEAMQVARKEGEREPLDIETLVDELVAELQELFVVFAGIDRTKADWESLMAAQERVPPGDARDAFAERFLKAHALWELLWPDESLLPLRREYRWLASVYESVQPSQTPDALLWHRLGAKTLELINEHVVSVTVRGGTTDHVTIDEETLEALRELGFEDIEVDEEGDGDGGSGGAAPTPEEIIESIEERVRKRLNAHPGSPMYKSLAARLEQLRQMQLVEAADSIEFLKRLLEVARDVVAADRGDVDEAGAEAAAAEAEPEKLVAEDRIGALTQLFNEVRPDATPDIVEQVVHDIDAVASGVKPPPGSDEAAPVNWQTSREGVRLVKQAIRVALNKYGLPPTGDLFERAYSYVAEHY